MFRATNVRFRIWTGGWISPKSMPKSLPASRDRRFADEAAQDMVQRAEDEREGLGVRQVSHLQNRGQDPFLQVTERTISKTLWQSQITAELDWCPDSMLPLKGVGGVR